MCESLLFSTKFDFLPFIPTFLLPFLPITFSTNETSGTFSGALTLGFWCIIFIPVCLLLTRFFLKQNNQIISDR
jgi:glycopeptide antibiotics resistance protein